MSSIDLPIVLPSELAQKTEKLYATGLPRGDLTGFDNLNQFYTVGQSQWTAITGYPGSGKSEFLDAMMVNLARSYGWKFAAVKFRSASAKFGVVLDPWNALESLRPPSMSETDYIGNSLTEAVTWVRDHKLHLWIVAHPAKMFRDKGGERPVPTPYDIAGSANWFNKPDNIITVHRPDYDDNRVHVHVQKVRFKNLGRVGVAELLYHRVTGTYTDAPRVRDIEPKNDQPIVERDLVRW